MNKVAPLDIVVFGLALSSAWGNGHATTYRALLGALAARGHRVRFFERDLPWYAAHRDLVKPAYCQLSLYSSIGELADYFPGDIAADVVIMGSYVPQGVQLAEWLLPRVAGLSAFYDIDTPVTAAGLRRGDCEYMSAQLVPRFDLYLSFSGGPILRQLQYEFGAKHALPLYCSVNPHDYFPCADAHRNLDVGYLGTYSADRQAALDRLLLQPARQWPAGRFCIAGAQYPDALTWPANVRRIAHLSPAEHRHFYNSQRITLNVTRADMIHSGYSPSVRLFEAAACGTPIMTDEWRGLGEFFEAGKEILIARTTDEALQIMRDTDAQTLARIGSGARRRVLAQHTSAHRAGQLEQYILASAEPSSGYRATSQGMRAHAVGET